MHLKKPIAALIVVTLVAALGLTVYFLTAYEPDPLVQNVYRPGGVADRDQLTRREDQQLATRHRFEAFHDFSFADRIEESRIRFRHKMVDDGGKAYKMIHYDHGNGVSVADVDGDGFYDLYFINQVGANELWRNRGDGRFENITTDAGVALDSVVSVAASFADIDNDGDPDLYVTTVRFGNYLFENDGQGRFKDISEASGLQHTGHSSGAVFFDYNRDGLLDLFLTNVGRYTTDELAPIRGRTRYDDQEGEYFYYVGIGDSTMGSSIPERDEPNLLFMNAGGNRFVDVTEEMGTAGRGWSGDASPMDVNEDGWPDLYVLNMQGDDEYYENDEGRQFVLKTNGVFGKTPYGSMGVEVLDYDNDGKLDLYLTDMHSDMWETSQHIGPGREKEKPKSPIPTGGAFIDGNALFRNEGAGTFQDMADATGTETYWPWGVSSGDLNADGYEDLFVSASMNYPFRYAINSVLLNNNGEEFLDSEFILRVEPRPDGRTAKIWYEVHCGREQHEVCDESGATGRVDVWGALGSRSSVLFDLDQDGDLDIVTNEFNSRPQVLVSNLSRRNPDLQFATIKLIGNESNRDGLGAIVRVEADDRTLTQVYDGKSGYLSQSSLPLYFGLGTAETIDRIEINWPSGTRQVVDGPLAVNRLIEVEEP